MASCEKLLMELICQEIEIKEWPLLKAEDEKFFGYVLAVGIMPNDFSNHIDPMRQYADFGYNDRYERYILPDNDKLKDDLLKFLWENMWTTTHSGCMEGKVWISRLENGYNVDYSK